jgi:PAS domain S-box-containing protein
MTRVLIVDDKPENLYLLRTLLEGNGCAVDEARHGAEALVKARMSPPDLVVSDLLMPVMDGYTLLRSWKVDERLRSIPFVVYTATYTEAKDERLALNLGADAFILKPAEPEELMTRLKELLARAQQGELPPAHAPEGDPGALLKDYGNVLIRKLEEKTLQLQQANCILKEELTRREQTEAEANRLRAEAERAHAVLLSILEEQRKAQEELRAEQALFQSLVSTIPDHIYFKDRQSRFIRINEPMARMFGLRDSGGAVGRTDFDFFTGEHAQQAFSDEQRIMSTGVSLIGFEEKETWPDGRITWASTSKVPLRDADGQITGLVGISRDITERKQTEAHLREQAALLEKANDAIYVRTLDHTITYWNRGAERLYGWTAAEALNRKDTDLFLPVNPGLTEAERMLVADGGWTGEMRHSIKGGGTATVFCRWSLMREDEERPAMVFAIHSDVTEHRELEARFLRAQRLENIGALAAGIAHDLNNVLSPMLLGAPILRKALQDETAIKVLDAMEISARRGGDIVKQVLTFARGVKGERIPLDPRHVLNDILRIVEGTFPKNIDAELNFDEKPWPVVGDATQFHQALLNLCINARDAMPNGGSLHLETSNLQLDETFVRMNPGAKIGPYVRIAVTDTGTGIPPENLDKLFVPFFTTKEPGKGTGLGLSTVLGIVHNHDGFVRVESAVGRGTTFALYLPAMPATAVPNELLHGKEAPHGNGELLLIVDDEVSIRDVLAKMLELYGYRVLSAGEGTEAVGLFVQHRAEIKAVITDMMMPQMDGATLISVLRHIEPGVRVIGFSGIGDLAKSIDYRNLDLPAFLTKPFTADKLLVTLNHILTNPAKKAGDDGAVPAAPESASR